MFGTIRLATTGRTYFGFLGTPGFFIVGGMIDIFESMGGPFLKEQVSSFIRIIPTLLFYLALSYLITCLVVLGFSKLRRKEPIHQTLLQ